MWVEGREEVEIRAPDREEVEIRAFRNKNHRKCPCRVLLTGVLCDGHFGGIYGRER